VVVGIALSLIWLISVATRPKIPELGRQPGTGVFRELAEYPDGQRVRGIVVLRLDGGLFFATSDALEDRIREVTSSASSTNGIVLDCGGVDFIDSQGSAKLGEIVTLTEEAGVTFHLARLKPAVGAVLIKDGVWDRIGADRIHGNVFRAVQAESDERMPEGRDDADHETR
jgi:SulP family sulfate permease